MDVRRLAPGLWCWTAPHPAWRPGADWPERVGCVYYEAADAVVLIDPLLPRGEEDEFFRYLDADVDRLGRPVKVLLTAPWHRRDADRLVKRYGASVGGALSAGVEALPVEPVEEGQVAYFIRPHQALVVAELFMGDGRGGLVLWPSPSLMDRAALDQTLQSLLDLPVELVLPGHGEPVLRDGRAAIELALREHLPT